MSSCSYLPSPAMTYDASAENLAPNRKVVLLASIALVSITVDFLKHSKDDIKLRDHGDVLITDDFNPSYFTLFSAHTELNMNFTLVLISNFMR